MSDQMDTVDLDGLRAHNNQLLRQLAAAGGSLDPLTTLKLRLDLVTAVLIGENPRFETMWEQVQTRNIEHALKNARPALITP